MNFRIPYYYPGWNLGVQIFDPGTGGPASHVHERITQPRIHPTVLDVALMGMGTMPTELTGVTRPISANDYSYPPHSLEISGLFKSPLG